MAAPLSLLALISAASLSAWWASASPEEAAWLGGLVPTLLHDLHGEWWRLLTAACLHIRPGHLVLNAVVLLGAGWPAGALLGGWMVVRLWLAGALVASVASLLFTQGWSLGASGANAAVVAGLLVAGGRRWRQLTAPQRRLLLVGTVPWLVALVGLGATGPTDHAAHLGGLLAGALVGGVGRGGRWFTGALVVAMAVALGFGLHHALRPPPTQWPPPGWVQAVGPPPCTTAWTDGLAHGCRVPAGPLPAPPTGLHTRSVLPLATGEVLVIFAPASPRGARLRAALAAGLGGGLAP